MNAVGRSAIMPESDGRRPYAPKVPDLAGYGGDAPRVRMPAFAVIGGARYRVHDWGLDGFTLGDRAPQGHLGDRREVTLQLMFDAFRLTLELTARVTRVVDSGAYEFAFVDLRPEHANAISHVVDGWLSGEPTPFGAAASVGVAVPANDPRETRSPPRYARIYRLTAGLAAALLVLVVLGTATVNRLLTVTSQYAAVAADLTQVRAAEDGVLADTRIAAGQRVQKGALLGYMHPAATTQEREAAAAQVAVVVARLNQEQSALSDANAGFHNFQSVASTGYKSAKDERAALDREIDTQTAVVGRYRALAREGYVSALQADQQEETLRDLQRQRAVATANEEAARQSLANADKGIYGADGHLTQRTPSQIQASIAELEAQQRQLNQQLSAMDTNLPLNAPCDCMVMAAHAANGQFVAKNGPIFDLGSEKDNKVEVDALVPANEIGTLRVGDPASIFLADRKTAIAGQIARINLNAANSGRTGLPDGLRSLDLYALVTVSVAAPGQLVLNEPAGTPASVEFPVRIAAFARSLIGLSPH